MKKILFSIGAIAFALVPAVVTVSCGSSNKNSKNGGNTTSETVSSSTPFSRQFTENFIKAQGFLPLNTMEDVNYVHEKFVKDTEHNTNFEDISLISKYIENPMYARDDIKYFYLLKRINNGVGYVVNIEIISMDLNRNLALSEMGEFDDSIYRLWDDSISLSNNHPKEEHLKNEMLGIEDITSYSSVGISTLYSINPSSELDRHNNDLLKQDFEKLHDQLKAGEMIFRNRVDFGPNSSEPFILSLQDNLWLFNTENGKNTKAYDLNKKMENLGIDSSEKFREKVTRDFIERNQH